MIRFFAVGAGIVVIRLVQPLIMSALSPAPLRDIFGLIFWAGWIVSVTVAELWIRATRASPPRRSTGHVPVAPVRA
jgi:hypothetical protein